MKLLRLVSLSVIFCISCVDNNANIEIVGKIQSEKEKELSREAIIKDPILNEKERLMYMTSFLIGKTILENKEARDYFYERILNRKINRIDLIKLIDLDYTITNPFEEAFEQQYKKYNWHTSPIAGGPVPPTVTAEPDAIRWGGVLDSQIQYSQYLVEVINHKNWELYFPNKSAYINQLQDLATYFMHYNTLNCLWSLHQLTLFSDGVILQTDGSGSYLPENFDLLTTNSLTFILRDKLD